MNRIFLMCLSCMTLTSYILVANFMMSWLLVLGRGWCSSSVAGKALSLTWCSSSVAGKALSLTVSSLRVDTVAAKGLTISRKSVLLTIYIITDHPLVCVCVCRRVWECWLEGGLSLNGHPVKKHSSQVTPPAVCLSHSLHYTHCPLCR